MWYHNMFSNYIAKQTLQMVLLLFPEVAEAITETVAIIGLNPM